jgi:hypothetical protein
MNNQQFIFVFFGSLSLVAFIAIGIISHLGDPKKKTPTAEPESRSRSAE